MSATEMMHRIEKASPRLRAKFVIAYYLFTALTCAFDLYYRGDLAFPADVLVAIVYLAITTLFYNFRRGQQRTSELNSVFDARGTVCGNECSKLC